jgi:hypothetical protein
LSTAISASFEGAAAHFCEVVPVAEAANTAFVAAAAARRRLGALVG